MSTLVNVVRSAFAREETGSLLLLLLLLPNVATQEVARQVRAPQIATVRNLRVQHQLYKSQQPPNTRGQREVLVPVPTAATPEDAW